MVGFSGREHNHVFAMWLFLSCLAWGSYESRELVNISWMFIAFLPKAHDTLVHSFLWKEFQNQALGRGPAMST